MNPCKCNRCGKCGKIIQDVPQTRGTNNSCEICTGKKCPICNKRHCNTIHDNCDSIPNADRIKQDTRNLYNALKGVNSTYANSNTYQDFLNLLATNGANENSVTLYYYAEENRYLLNDLIQGSDPYGVDILGSSSHAVATLHSHPNDTPPSGVDIMTAANHAYENPDFQSAYIYTSSGVYTLFIENREKAIAFYQAYMNCNSTPGSSDVFKEGSDLDTLWDTSYQELKDYSDNDRHMLALSYILRTVDSGISIAKGDNSTAIFEVITTRMENKRIIPIKCK